MYENGSLHLDISRHIVRVDGRDVALTPTEFRLLTVLVNNAGLVMSINRLEYLVWGDEEVSVENVRQFISYLRKKLDGGPSKRQMIATVREFGYRYNPPEEHSPVG